VRRQLRGGRDKPGEREETSGPGAAP
jgi:hypothetical protein